MRNIKFFKGKLHYCMGNARNGLTMLSEVLKTKKSEDNQELFSKRWTNL